MIEREALLRDLQALTTELIGDLRDRTDNVSEVEAAVGSQYKTAKSAGRTDRSYEEWREDLLAQVAVAWVLATVFVRFCEDNDLYSIPLLSGPGDRRELAADHRIAWLGDHPASGDRDWLLEVFGRYRELPGLHELLGDHNPLWQFGPSDDGAKAILKLWRAADEATGELKHDFVDAELDTRFLGDLYQDLSDHAKKNFALLQTPEFVEEFILDRTLDPAIETFGLAETKLIDPTCGSGHFLLGAFDRILEQWRQREPGTPIRELAQRTLDAVSGVDLNPFAVAIARFRLLVAALKAANIARLADAPNFRFRVAVGDSLIHGTRSGELFTGAEGFSALIEHRYPSEDGELANEILQAGTYHAVVGNPPYITVKEPALRDVYRAIYSTAYMQYSLGVPFTERFFDLAVGGSGRADGGFVGLITTNSFMKRQFGKKIIEEWFPRRDLTHVIDTSGAYIPGHGTPTVILFGRNQVPSSDSVRSVLGIRGEPGRPADPARAKVWTSILTGIDQPGWENDLLSVEDLARQRFSTHPWSLQGGAAPGVKKAIEMRSDNTLGSLVTAIGATAYTRADDVYVHPVGVVARQLAEEARSLPFVTGTDIRDWVFEPKVEILFPYDHDQHDPCIVGLRTKVFLWPYRSLLWERNEPNGSIRELGMEWFEWARFLRDRFDSPVAIAFAFVATHNHFVFERGPKIFNRSGSAILLPADASATDHLQLLGLLNSSTACFWMKQVFHNKGEGGGARVDAGYSALGDEPWKSHYEFDGTKLKQFPVPTDAPLALARELDRFAEELRVALPTKLFKEDPPTRSGLDQARRETESIRAQMVACQEELDWQCYHIFGLADRDLRAPRESVPELQTGKRAFEIVLARRMAMGEVESTWFERHGSTPITELPAEWPEAYREVVQERIALIESNRGIRLLERPEHKRRWSWDSWEDLEREALQRWLLDRLEVESLWSDCELRTTAQLADLFRRDEEFVDAAVLYTGRSDYDLALLVGELVEEESVPFAVGYRFRPSGMRRRRVWEKVWKMQRREDEIDARTELDSADANYLSAAAASALKEDEGLASIPVPPRYRKSDYASNTAYKLRGKLDVPQERFISYPDTHIGSDTSLVIGWAGWDHLERAKALAAHYGARRDAGANVAELTALLAGLQELVPWLQQWHNDIDPEYGDRMGDFFASFVEMQARTYGLTTTDLSRWTPGP